MPAAGGVDIAYPPEGAAAAIRGVLMGRKTIFEMEAKLRGIVAPTLVVVGDRDDGALDASLFMARTMRYVGIVMLPFTGHTPNLEEPLLFNLHVGEFLAAVSEGRWATWRGGSSSGAEGEANADRDQ